MRQTVFYSWQSDIAGSVNRSFVEDALGRAITSIKKDEQAIVEPVLDRDTLGEPGSPAIADTIFRKIMSASVFVADVTIINSSSNSDSRLTPNPNVLLELGFTVSVLGWDRIILVMNAAFGEPEILPFDLRGRRIATYTLKEGQDKAVARTTLVAAFERQLRSVLPDSVSSQVYAGPEVPLWFGAWSIQARGGAFGGSLFIREVGASGFLFRLFVFSGAHMGNVSGFARFSGPDFAFAHVRVDPSTDPCELTFRRSFDRGRREIEVTEVGGCLYFHGMGATFSGTYEYERIALFEIGYLDELDLARVYSITRKHYQPLMACFHAVSEVEKLDELVDRAFSGAPRGLFTIQEGIVVLGKEGQLWVAYIDGDEVRYFTTEYKYRTNLPKTVEVWRERFANKEVVYDTDIDEESF